jgi:integrase/recombinase XerD
MIKKLFNHGNLVRWNTFDKETVDEIIFKASNLRNRIILELMARGGMRVGEVLKLTPNDIHEKKLTLRAPKSGKKREFVFIPQKVADRLKDYVREKGIPPHLRIFPICSHKRIIPVHWVRSVFCLYKPTKRDGRNHQITPQFRD